MKSDLMMEYSRPVSFVSLWLRIHSGIEPYYHDKQGVRTLSIYNGLEVVAETSLVLKANEWYLITPKDQSEEIIGDCLIIDE